MFPDRAQEVPALEALFQSPGGKLARLYGRRRLGKTKLLRCALERHGGLSFTIPEPSRAGILRYLNEETSRQTGRPLHDRSFPEFFEDMPRHGRRLVVLDEFQRLKQAERAIESTLQAAWDTRL